MGSDEIRVVPGGPLKGRVHVPGDKSVSHRSLMFAALAEGVSEIHNLQDGLDVLATERCLKGLGIGIRREGGIIYVEGRGPKGFTEPTDILDCGNSGTTMRLMAGVLAGQDFLSVLTGDRHLHRRPMARVLDPLREMGALALGRAEDTMAPLILRGGTLRGLRWDMPIATAQVKSAVLLAGLNARGVTTVTEPELSRDHTERMLAAMGVELERNGAEVSIRGGQVPQPGRFDVPGDPSSAAFWAGAALLVPGSELVIENVSLNPTRIGFFKLIERMGADIAMIQTGEGCGEPVGEIRVAHSSFKGIEVEPREVPAAIDEFPIFTVVASRGEGTTVIRGAEELRHKESDRIDALAEELAKAGVEVETFADGMKIFGGGPLRTARFDSRDDHRLAMSMGVLSLAIDGGGVIENGSAADVSYPGFFEQLSRQQD